MDINLTLIMQAVAFAAFIWFTAKFVWPPLMNAIEARRKTIADGLAAGEQGRQNLASSEKRVADMFAEAKTKASEIVAQGEKFKSETMERAKVEAKRAALAAMSSDVAGASSSSQQAVKEKDRMRRLVESGYVSQRDFDVADSAAATCSGSSRLNICCSLVPASSSARSRLSSRLRRSSFSAARLCPGCRSSGSSSSLSSGWRRPCSRRGV